VSSLKFYCHIFRDTNSWGIPCEKTPSLRAAVALPGQSPHARLDEIGSWPWRAVIFFGLFEAFGAKNSAK